MTWWVRPPSPPMKICVSVRWVTLWVCLPLCVSFHWKTIFVACCLLRFAAFFNVKLNIQFQPWCPKFVSVKLAIWSGTIGSIRAYQEKPVIFLIKAVFETWRGVRRFVDKSTIFFSTLPLGEISYLKNGKILEFFQNRGEGRKTNK